MGVKSVMQVGRIPSGNISECGDHSSRANQAAIVIVDSRSVRNGRPPVFVEVSYEFR